MQVVKDLRSRGIPLDGVGHEMHNAINYPSVDAMVNAIDTMARHFPDLDQQITELDMSIYNAGDTTTNYGPNVPPSLLAAQGWLYHQYFEAFRHLRGKISRVTLWGMADDDTWLDSFPVNRTDYPLPFDHNLQAKPAYWGIVDKTQLPGYGLRFTGRVSTGKQNTRTVTLTATNGSAGTAYATQISSFALKEVLPWGGPHCSPVVTAPGSFPILLGDIAANGSASATFTVSLKGCNPHSVWQITAPWNANTFETGTFRMDTDFDNNADKPGGWKE